MIAPTRFRIAVVAPFPHPHLTFEGWMTRIAHIDAQLAGTPRIYLHFSEGHDDSQSAVVEHDTERAEALLTPGGDASTAFVSRLADTVDAFYVHTLHLAEHVLPWLDTGKVYVDIHGVTPEEEELLGRPHLRARYEAVEQAVLRDAACCIGVSRAMTEHYAAKYPSLSPRWLTVPVAPSFPAAGSCRELPADDRRPVALYSGAVQAWQNLDAMLDLAASAGDAVEFRLFSHDHAVIRRRIAELGLTPPPLVDCCSKEDLPAVYEAADLGLILRDDSPVNRVACPTKLAEYLFFGLIPVVRSPRLGDFQELGYAFITEQEFRAGFIPDAASRRWMAEQNLHVVRQLADRFEVAARELQSRLSETAATPAPAPAVSVCRDVTDRPSAEQYLELGDIDCTPYLGRKPAWVTRDQSHASLKYIMGLVKHFKPRSMLEIGVSAGLTSGALLAASHGYDEYARVYGIDVANTVYYAPEKAVGALIDEVYPEFRSRYHLFLGKDSTDIPALIPEPIDFVFVDTLHAHPWPTLDVLNALTRIGDGGIVALDGVHFGAPGHDGSAYFFHHYDGDKQTCDAVQTGALQVHDRQALFEHCCEVLELVWQADVGGDMLPRTVANVAAHFGRAAAERLRAICEPRHEHFLRFRRTYDMAATIQWHYVEAMQRQGVQASLDSGTARLESADDAPFRDLRHFRRSVLDRCVDLPCRILEVGAYCAPTVDPSEAAVKFLDFYSTDELEAMARKSGEDPAAVVSVDYVCRTDHYPEVVNETFDAVIANHVFEHVDRAIRWLAMVRGLLRDGGVLFLVLPDKKRSFDRFRSDTPLSHLLFEDLAPEQDISSIHSLETELYYDKTYIGETNQPKARLDVEHLKRAIGPSHPGVHRHVFQAETFAGRILKPLLYTGLVDFDLLNVTNCPQFGEFAVVLKAGRNGQPDDAGDLYTPATDSVPVEST